MEVRNTLERISEKDLRIRYKESTVKYEGEVVMEGGVLKDTPLAREWWKKKRNKKASRSPE